MVNKTLAFVLSGGGARGALQAGALYALLESGYQPDLLVGTSIGAVNAAFLALNGFSKSSLDHLAEAWRRAAALELLPANYVWLAVRAMLGRSNLDPAQRIKDFFIENGLAPDLRFASLQRPRLAIVSADLNSGQPVLHGDQIDEKILDALLLSTALPPWVMPVRRQGRYEMDGGLVSNLPIEPALRSGATEIVALDLLDMRDSLGSNRLTGFLGKVSMTVEKRQADLELELAQARSIPTLYLNLVSKAPISFWDFQHAEALIQDGYEIARGVL